MPAFAVAAASPAHRASSSSPAHPPRRPIGRRPRPPAAASVSAVCSLPARGRPAPALTAPERERDALIAAHLELARKIASQVHGSIGRAVDLDELIAIGFEGLVQAAARFRSDRGTSFATFARYRIRGAIYDGLRRSGIPRRIYRALALRAPADARAVGDDRALAPGDAEVAGAAGRPSPPPTVEETVRGREVAAILARSIERLSPEEQHIIRAHYYAGESLQDAGRARGRSKSWASRLHARGIEQLRLRLAPLACELTA